MSGTEKRTISLKPENTSFIDAKVKSGGYASASEVVRAGLRALQERDEAVERWLHNEVVPTYDAIRDGSVKTHPVGDAFDALRARHVAKNGNS